VAAAVISPHEPRRPFGRKEVLACIGGMLTFAITLAALVVMGLQPEVKSDAALCSGAACGAFGLIFAFHQSERGKTDRAELANGNGAT